MPGISDFQKTHLLRDDHRFYKSMTIHLQLSFSDGMRKHALRGGVGFVLTACASFLVAGDVDVYSAFQEARKLEHEGNDKEAFLKFLSVPGGEFAAVSLARGNAKEFLALLLQNPQTLESPRVALGSIANVPHQVAAANEFLDGKVLDEAVAARAADLILQGAKPLEMNAYKVPMAHALIRRALLKLKGDV